MTKNELEKNLRRQAGDLIYCWLQNDDFQYFGNKANILRAKRDKQIAYLKGLAYAVSGVKEYEMYDWIKDEIKKTYQQIKNPATGVYEPASPRLIIAALMLGETVKGKNWQKGIYGCKVGNVANYVELPTYSLEELSTGNVDYVSLDRMNVNGNTSSVNPTYDLSVSQSSPASISLIDKMDNIINTYQLTSDGNYQLNTISDGSTTVEASTGKEIKADNQTLWNNINNCIGQIQSLINGFATFLSGITAPEALAPVQVQDGWVEPEKSSSLSSSTGLLVGGAILAAAFITNDNKRK